ncbi:MAG: DUF4886 domain-containing protein [Oscillospiraceae bacterium]|nr:DUF4886 domain-containing protein [Oscillospiraceae bacterium]
MTKKLLRLFLAMICVLSLCLTGCSKPADDTTGSTAASTTETIPTTADTTPTEEDTSWKADNTLKILTIGNSFSSDCMEYVYHIARVAGVRKIKLGNLYQGGCSLERHLGYAKEQTAAYTFYTCETGKWTTKKEYKLADAVISDDWDFVCFQQASGSSGLADTYDDLNALMDIVEPLCLNKNVEFMWHMTWAYQGDSTHDSFVKYESKQDVMYNAIVNATMEKIVSNSRISRIIPNGTAIQNARTSYLGDTLTRDGYHLSTDEGRIIAGISMVAATVGIDWEKINLSAISSDEKFLKVALESAQNAIENPFEVTQSQFTK